MSKTYIFTIDLQGTGDTIDEAWADATGAFAQDPGDYDPNRAEEEEE